MDPNQEQHSSNTPPAPTEHQLSQLLAQTRRAYGEGHPRTVQAVQDLQALRDKKRMEKPLHVRFQTAQQDQASKAKKLDDARRAQQQADKQVQ